MEAVPEHPRFRSSLQGFILIGMLPVVLPLCLVPLGCGRGSL